MSDLRYTSIPGWALPGETAQSPTYDGTHYLLVSVGEAGALLADEWADALAKAPGDVWVSHVTGTDPDEVTAHFRAALANLRVGFRICLAGATAACLALRAIAVQVGVEDDELHVTSTGQGAIDVWCAHCHYSTSAEISVGEVVACDGCGRRLVAYHHVSRRSGKFLGYQIDAEQVGEVPGYASNRIAREDLAL